MSRTRESYDKLSQGDDICRTRMRYNLPCKDCIYKDTDDCTKRRRKKENVNSKEKRSFTEL